MFLVVQEVRPLIDDTSEHDFSFSLTVDIAAVIVLQPSLPSLGIVFRGACHLLLASMFPVPI